MSLGEKCEQFVEGKVKSGDQQTARGVSPDGLPHLEKEELLKEISVLMMSELEAKLPETVESVDVDVKKPNAFKRLWKSAFTLIELAISLVIIGLITGGIMVGQDMIKAAEVRAQIAQIEKFNTADKTFRLKFGFHPGDVPDPAASAFGFKARGALPGEGDGNGIISAVYGVGAGQTCGSCETTGENALFWVDLSTANLIDGNFTTATASVFPGGAVTGASVGNYLPSAKIGRGNYVYVYDYMPFVGGVWQETATNYYGLSLVNSMDLRGVLDGSAPGLSVQSAYNIDSKIDDGLPQSGAVIAAYIFYAGPSQYSYWAGGPIIGAPYTTTTAGSSTSCFDNSATSSGTPGVNGAVQHYSTEINSGNGINCTLSFKFQ